MLKGLISIMIWIYFLFVFLQIIAFQINLGMQIPKLGEFFPYSIENGELNPDFNMAIMINIGLLSLFAIPHSLFPRTGVKEILGMNKDGTSLYRSLFVLQSSGALHLLMKYWQPIWKDRIIWN